MTKKAIMRIYNQLQFSLFLLLLQLGAEKSVANVAITFTSEVNCLKTVPTKQTIHRQPATIRTIPTNYKREAPGDHQEVKSTDFHRRQVTIDSPYRYTKNGWENSTDWYIETKKAEPVSIWISVHPAVWASGLFLVSMMVLVGISREEEIDLMVKLIGEPIQPRKASN